MASNGLIYVLGGVALQNTTGQPYIYANFTDVITFNTQSTQWNFITATGDQPSQRDSHSTVQSKYLHYI